ncbi:Uncharacterized protein APZ42_017228 [Daphnia magna]|uniref:Chitin-binding type-2 domain-containing protein n=1 Tax=Daphnia magna TaxID=35525 RepID=A0A164ZQW5_9CRUS|nr:Uncharacterized protein APZ42_017228 [Daphnia magna]
MKITIQFNKEDSSSSKEDSSSGEIHSTYTFEEETTAKEDLTSPPPPEPSTEKSIVTVSTEKSIVTVTPEPTPFDCQFKSNGNYVNPSDCKTYIACSNGNTYIMVCPANLVYNENGWCDYVYNVPRCM